MSAATFQLEQLGADLASAIPELQVGPWAHAPRGMMAFDAGLAQPGSLWRVDLARNDASSQAAFTGGERSVARTHAVLDEVPRRLDRALDRALTEITRASRHELPRGDRGPAAAPELAAESSLIAALTGAELPAPLASEGIAWSAEPGPASASSSGRDLGQLERALAAIADLARGRARIETQLEGALVAHSVMTLSGDTEIWIAPRLSMAGARLHARSVAVAARTRHAWARILTLVVTGCARLAVLGLPAAGVAALPVVWRFLRDLLREVRVLGAAPS